MADYNSNMIKPVEGLQSITGLSPAKRREERERKRQLHQENEEKDEQQLNESSEEQNGTDSLQEWSENSVNRDKGGAGIDYHA
jgi:hypothetical protein